MPVAVSGASVSISVTNGSQTKVGPGTTGTVTFNWSKAPRGTYTTTVTEVVATGLDFDGSTPPNSFTK